MPRRRHPRRLEWSSAMQSHITLVDQPLHHPTSSPSHRSPMADTFGADTFAADARPAHIRATPRPTLQTPRAPVQTSRPATRTQTLLSETTPSASPTSASSSSAAKTPPNVVRRMRDSLKRQLRTLGHIVRHVPESSV
ncbi:hypothetical protein GGI15_004233 [Coemansia interrupta]|uniref:Uncharacterized protein n=1 Tax=Coemansia interrupta TaxID=1126814 RepID=A0A9W8H9Z2_9FUNG|nr:hypothetical protein GGI15_004233 [Coemansia interrupta]